MRWRPDRKVRPAASVATAAAVIALVACDSGAPEAGDQAGVAKVSPDPAEESRRSIRLVDRIASAGIQSPLRGLDPASSLKDIEGDVPRTRVFGEDFERFSPARVRWQRPFACEKTRREEGEGRGLVYRGGGGHRCFFVLPARPSTHYRVRRSVRTDDTLVDLRVLESRVGLRRPKRMNDPADIARVGQGRFLKARNLVFVHRFAEPAEDTWVTSDMHLFTSPHTRSLVIVVHDTESVVGSTEREARFDDLLVERLQPTQAQELSLLKYRDLAEGADPALGMVKHGQFLPVGKPDDVAPPYDSNHDYRYGLFAPTPTDLTFTLTVPGDSRLRLSMGLMKSSRPGDEVTFSVRAAEDAGPAATLVTRTLAARVGDGWHWHNASVLLDRYAGKKIRLTLRTRAPEGSRGYGVWGNPVIEVTRRPDDPPNVILIAVDTLRADRLSCYGHDRETSPKIDALAAGGVRFERAIANSNWTSPSFASLFTGLPSSRHQVIHRASVMAPEQQTLAEVFRDAGWATHAIAYKTYLYNMGFEQGFDRWFNLPRIDVRADDNIGKALAWLEHNADQRFFLFLHLNDPHQPFNQPPPFDRKYNDVKDLTRFGLRLPIIIGPEKGIPGCSGCMNGKRPVPAFRRLAHDLYDGEVSYLDDRIGRFLEALKQRGLYDDALIAFASDHGELMWERGLFFGHGGPSVCDELVRVPLIVKPPKGSGLPVGRSVAAQVRLYDLMPTLIELVGLPLDGLDIEAESLVPLLEKPDVALDRVAVSENFKHHKLSIRDGEWAYELNYRPGRPVRERLYRGREHPTRSASVAGDHPRELRELRRQAMAFFLRNRSGRYIVVSGDGQPRRYTVRLISDRPLTAVRTFFGLTSKRRLGRKEIRFTGKTDGEVVLFARLPVRAGARLQLVVEASGPGEVHTEKELLSGEIPQYEEGRLAALLSRSEVTGELFAGPPRITHKRKKKLDAQRIEALRSLGYME